MVINASRNLGTESPRKLFMDFLTNSYMDSLRNYFWELFRKFFREETKKSPAIPSEFRNSFMNRPKILSKILLKFAIEHFRYSF